MDAAIAWLLASSEPAVVALTRRDLLGEAADEDVLGGKIVRALLDADPDAHPYKKWQGAHWRLVSLVELGVPPGEERAIAAAGRVLEWLTGDGHRRGVVTIDGLVRRCASQEGNALAACCRVGLAGDPRVELLARSLVDWQWPDGGWNCDKRATGYRSSFNESLSPMWGLHEYVLATGDTAARDAARRTAELFLEHGLFRSPRTGEVSPTRVRRRPSRRFARVDARTGRGAPAPRGGGRRAAARRTSRPSTGARSRTSS